MVSRASEFKARFINCIRKIGGCKYLLLIGINQHQRSYLDFLNDYKVIELNDVNAVDKELKHLTKKTEYISCRSDQITLGAFLAGKAQKLLQIDPGASDLNVDRSFENGLIVIENREHSNTANAINFALSVNADIDLIPVPDMESKEITNELARWRTSGDNTILNNLSARVYPILEKIPFSKYKFASFFTGGIPYPLFLANVIPFTCIESDLQPDFFFFNNIYSELNEPLPSSIVFSPLEFGTDEETQFVINTLHERNYYVRELVGEEATSINIERNVTEFPFSVLHFCSHGGEVDGFPMRLEFTDRDEKKHIVEYDEVVSFAPEFGNPLVQVTSKWIFRKFDGYVWRSKELKEQEYPHYVFADMTDAIHNFNGRRTQRVNKVADSSAIKCHDFTYFAVFNNISGHHASPFIFNNTCWSCTDISHSFISTGARGYLGTLWDVNNKIARNVAESFYQHAFDMTVLEALQIALKETHKTKDENIYVFWGLHFTRLKTGSSIRESRLTVTKKLSANVNAWKRHITGVSDPNVREGILPLIKWSYNQIVRQFFPEAVKLGIISFTRERP
jgi:hypothetical protein